MALLVVALGFFLGRGLHPPAKATSPGDAGPSAHAGADLGHSAATPPRADGGARAAHATVVLSASWGGGNGQLGRRSDPESMTEGPMSLVVDAGGVTILDNVNRRVARFDTHGRTLPPIALDTDAAQDRARARDRIAVLDRLHDKRVPLYDNDGSARATLPLA
ncbi:MAG: hypothetical protein ACXVDD_29110, partial [Polyangia bacterium]